MHFSHYSYQPGETIAAIATPPGEGGVAVIRISGKEAIATADKIFSGKVSSYKTHTVHYGWVQDAAGDNVDSALAIVMHGPRSFTGEDTVEIQSHGGSLVSRRVLEVILAAGARPALPGEFSFKAFMNGKLDLAQAEAIQDLICAKNELSLKAAEDRLKGVLSKKIADFQSQLITIAAILEACVDFPEEDIEFASMEEICERLAATATSMQELAETFHDGKIIHDGLSLCLAGCPNVGKSSLMNALLDKDRAIVTPIPGTTRDTLEEGLRLNGLNLRLIDTAGIREASEIVEIEGIRRSKQAMKEADLILLVLDAERGLNEEDRELIRTLPEEKTIAIWNKIDLPHPNLPELPLKTVVSLSAKTKQGIATLHESIDKVIWKNGPPSKEEVIITNLRHKEALVKAIKSFQKVIKGLRTKISPEFLSFEMRQCLKELGHIIGIDVTEDILSSIFSQFCIGK